MNTVHHPNAAAIESAMNETAEAFRTLWRAQDVDAPASHRAKLRSQADAAALRSGKLQTEARDAFAAFYGWTFNKKLWTSDHPVMDHVEFFDSSSRRGIALVSHTYADVDAVARYAAANDLKAEVLPFSWWNPSGCTAVLFTAKGGLSMSTLTVKGALVAMQGAGIFYSMQRRGLKSALWRVTDRGAGPVAAEWLQQWLVQNVSKSVPYNLAARLLGAERKGFISISESTASLL